MNSKDKKEVYEIVGDALRNVMVPALEDMESRMNEKFDKLEDRFDIRFDKLDERLDRQGKTLDNHEGRIEKLEASPHS